MLNLYALNLVLGNSCGHGFKPINIDDVVKFDIFPIINGWHGDVNGSLYFPLGEISSISISI